MDLSEYENINQVNEFNYLTTPSRQVQSNDGLYLKRNDEMIYLGTLSDAINRSFNSDAPGYDIIGIDGTNYGDINDPEINKNFYILKPPIAVVSGKSAKKVPEGEKNKGGKKRKTRRRKSRHRKTRRIKSRRI